MRELVRTNDLVLISAVGSLLDGASIKHLVFDQNMSVLEGSVGILARRVVCRATSGMDVRAGDRYGIMKLGSRMDIFLPMTATLRVRVGDVVRGGETVIAVLH